MEEDGLVISADKGKRKATKLRKQSREKKKRQVCNSLFKSKEQMALIKANIPDLDCIRSDPYDLAQPIHSLQHKSAPGLLLSLQAVSSQRVQGKKKTGSLFLKSRNIYQIGFKSLAPPSPYILASSR